MIIINDKTHCLPIALDLDLPCPIIRPATVIESLGSQLFQSLVKHLATVTEVGVVTVSKS